MKYFFWIALTCAVLAGLWLAFVPPAVAPLPEDEDTEPNVTTTPEVPADIQAHIDSKADLIRLESPAPLTVVDSPLTLTGEARGYWFFEASFPIVIVNWDGLIIAEGFATADGEWMTEEFVPFTAELEFESPYEAGQPDFMQRGAIILQKDNPSGLPENDDAVEIPILFASKESNNTTSLLPQVPNAFVSVYEGFNVPNTATSLDLSNRSLSGSLKAEIRQLQNLQQLDISNNDFTGLPAEVGQLSNLQILNLSNNPLTGLPQELGNLSNLLELDLRGTNYSEFDLDIIKQSLPASVKIYTD